MDEFVVNTVELPKHVLVVEDDSGLLRLIVKSLNKAGFESFGVSKGLDAIDYIKSNNNLVMLLDQQLPDMTGIEIVAQLSEQNIKVPFIVMTGQGDERLAVRMMKLGALDYLIKDIELIDILPDILNRVFNNLLTESKLKISEESLRLSEEKLRTVFSTIDEALTLNELIFDEFGKIIDYRILEANPAFEIDTGLKRKDVVGKLATEIYNMSSDYITEFWDKNINSESAIVTDMYLEHSKKWKHIITSKPKNNHFVISYTDITVLKQTESELLASKERYRVLSDNTSDFTYTCLNIDNNFRIDWMAGAVGKLTGYSIDEIMERGCWRFLVHKDDDSIFIQNVIKLQPDEKSECELRIITKNNEIKWLQVNNSCNLDIETGHQKLYGSCKDITKSKEIEKSLRDSELKFRSYIHNSPDGIFVTNENGNYVEVNQSAELITGFSQSELSTKSISDILSQESIEAGIKHFSTLKETGKSTGEFLVVHKSGEKRWISVDAVKLSNTRYLGFSRDITGRIKAEEELRMSNEFSNSLLRTIPFEMDIVDSQGNVLFLSDNLLKKYGSNINCSKCWELYRDDKKQCAECPLLAGIRVGETKIFETSGVLGSRVFQISHTGMIFQGKKAMLEIFQDVTDRKLMEKELIESKEKAEESDRLKTAFLQNMSHEIRTPLNGIIGFSNLLISDDITKTEMNEFAGIILKSGKRLIEIVNNVLDVSKIETGQVEIYKRSVPVNTIIKDLHGLFSHHAEVVNLDLNYQIAFDDSFYIFSDDSKIHQILSNLINNAIKFTESGSIDFGYEVIDDFLQFFVKDTGIGISEENRYKIFERFTQVDLSINRGYEGAGLGLAICKGLAELLGGRIWVESEVGVGSVFYFTIPTN